MRRRTLLLAAPAAAWLGAGALRLARAQAEPPLIINIIARRFVFLPGTITVRRGVPVQLVLTAVEVVMGFYAPALQLRAVIVPGTPTRLDWRPDQAGRYDFICDIFCGDGHESMNGQLIVEP